VKRGEGPDSLVEENLWIAWDIHYTPRAAGIDQVYDSADPGVIDRHLEMIRAAGFDALIFDLTNNVGTWFIKSRALAVCERLAQFNAGRPPADRLRFAIAIGGIQFTNPPNPAMLEVEADEVWRDFVQPFNEHYARWKGKPLLVAYMEQAHRDAWRSSPDHARSDRFSVGDAQGTINTGPAGYFGWGVLATLPHPDVMTVMPGWDNNKGGPIKLRNRGDFFNQGWRQVVTHRPRLVVVNSFNEFAEETGVEPADTFGAPGRNAADQPWADTYGAPVYDWYWTMTRQWNHLFRTRCFLDGTYVKQVGSPDVFRWTGGMFAYQGAMPHGEPVIEVPAGWLQPCPG
jgi:hypothetical protein